MAKKKITSSSKLLIQLKKTLQSVSVYPVPWMQVCYYSTTHAMCITSLFILWAIHNLRDFMMKRLTLCPCSIQHYPLYRVSDAGCTGQDAAPPEERHLLFREKYDVLSKEASQRVSCSAVLSQPPRLLLSLFFQSTDLCWTGSVHLKIQ